MIAKQLNGFSWAEFLDMLDSERTMLYERCVELYEAEKEAYDKVKSRAGKTSGRKR